MDINHPTSTINNPDLWGLDPDAAVAPVCPLKLDGQCPRGCRACIDFQEELDAGSVKCDV